jgi:hypothetical protein
MAARRFWTEAECQVLLQHYADTLTADIARALGRKTGTVHQKAAKLGLTKNPDWVRETARRRSRNPGHGGMATQLKPGTTPWNRGVHYQPGGRSVQSRFVAGNRPHNWVPVGTLRVNKGVLEQKFSDDPGPPNRRWKAYMRVVWERDVGTVPAGYVVVFKPGRSTTDAAQITPDALECITRSALMQRNSVHQLPRPLAKLVQLRGALNRQINHAIRQDAQP